MSIEDSVEMIYHPYLLHSEYDDATHLWQPKGLWWDMPPAESIRAGMAEAIEAPVGIANLTLDRWQQWGTLDWKEPHTSVAAVRRFAAKILEEGGVEVLQEYTTLTPSDAAPYAGELIDEIGDVTYVGNGILSNAQQSLMMAVRHRLRDQYVPFRPPRPITVGDIDELMADGFQPRILIGDYPEDFDENYSDYDELDPEINWRLIAGFLSTTSQQGIDESPDGTMSLYHVFPDSARMLRFLVADSVLFAAYSARRWGGGSLETVIRHNVAKIAGRVAGNQIDKSDMPR